ncbi:MAG TPA: MBL fold metallo-hydrolase [Gemmatimonadaceae bacterium]|nr:MBL fold metallo-hydrolase [Gemmatimonadaceae bacterium]
MTRPSATIHRFQASLFPVNAYLIEAADSVVAVDATLGVSDGRALRAHANGLGKPFAGVIVTHAHPDHYGAVGALVDGTNVPIVAMAGTDAAIRRDDAAKEQILRPMFGNEWAAARTFPNRVARDGERVTLGDVTLRGVDVGPAESPHDSWWLLEDDGPPMAFVGDLIYSHMHSYLADGFYEEWLANLERAKRELPADATLHMGHGAPAKGLGLIDWQAGYIRHFLDEMASARRKGLDGDALAAEVTARMRAFLESDDLLFLLTLSVAPMLGVLRGRGIAT